MLHPEMKPPFKDSPVPGAILEGEYTMPEVRLCQVSQRCTAETEKLGQQLFRTALGLIHQEATA
jgi:hypothetical protein